MTRSARRRRSRRLPSPAVDRGGRVLIAAGRVSLTMHRGGVRRPVVGDRDEGSRVRRRRPVTAWSGTCRWTGRRSVRPVWNWSRFCRTDRRPRPLRRSRCCPASGRRRRGQHPGDGDVDRHPGLGRSPMAHRTCWPVTVQSAGAGSPAAVAVIEPITPRGVRRPARRRGPATVRHRSPGAARRPAPGHRRGAGGELLADRDTRALPDGGVPGRGVVGGVGIGGAGGDGGGVGQRAEKSGSTVPVSVTCAVPPADDDPMAQVAVPPSTTQAPAGPDPVTAVTPAGGCR